MDVDPGAAPVPGRPGQLVGFSREPHSRHRAGRGRRLRQQGLRLPGGRSGVPPGPEAEPAGQVDGHPQRGLPHHLPGTRPGHDLGTGPEQGRQDAGPQDPGGGEPGRLPALRHGRTAPAHAGDGARLLPDPGRAGGDRLGLHQHRAHGPVPRRRAAGIGAQHRAAGGQGRPRPGHGSPGASPQELHPAGPVPLPHRRERGVRLGRL